MSCQLNTLNKKELSQKLKCSVRTIERWLEDVDEDMSNWPIDLLPPGKYVANKWLWKENVVAQWLSPVLYVKQESGADGGSLAQITRHYLK